jgi:hypothetical protein
MLDTFNELLVRAFSLAHPSASLAYKKALNAKTKHLNWGSWVWNPALAQALPTGVAWFRDVHETRVTTDLAHAKGKKGDRTKPVSFQKRESLARKATAPWAELIREWKKLV